MKATITERKGFHGVEYVVERETFAPETHHSLERAQARAAWMDSMAGELDSLDLTPRTDGDPAAPTPTMPARALTAAENATARRQQAAFDAAEIDA